MSEDFSVSQNVDAKEEKKQRSNQNEFRYQPYRLINLKMSYCISLNAAQAIQIYDSQRIKVALFL
jgi:hypothetical protein